MSSGFNCATCGEFHEERPLCFGPPAPALWYDIPETERAERCQLSSDQCIIDEEYHFILGRIELPIIGTDECFVWLAWTSLSPANFDRAAELWSTPGREAEPPYFGWLSTSLPYSAPTINLRLNVHTRPVGERPRLELQACDHPLYHQQQEGLSRQAVQELVEQLLHG